MFKKPRAKIPDRTTPHDHASERGIIGCCLLQPILLSKCVERMKGRKDIFDDMRHQSVFEAMIRTVETRKGLDVIALHDTLRQMGISEESCPIHWLATFTDEVPSAANLEYYLDIVLEKYLLRQMLQVCNTLAPQIYDYAGNVMKLLDGFERDVLNIRPKDSVRSSTIRQLVGESINLIERCHQNQGALMGLSTGLTDLDKMTSGFMPGEMTVIAAYPSAGKTAIAMNIADHLAVDCGIPVGVFSLEMPSEQLVTRMICARARVNLKNIKDGWLTERDFPKITLAASKLQKAPIYIDDESDQSISQIRAKARRMVQEHGVKFFVGDYLQLATEENSDSREDEVSKVAAGWKKMSKELGAHSLVLSQLNDQGKLRESRAIGQHADNVMFLEHVRRGENGEPEENHQECVPMNLGIRKQRNGPVGNVPLTFLRSFTKFESAARVSDEDVQR